MIVAFTKDWTDVPTCTTHVLRELARAMPVLWIESIGTRKPSLSRGGGDWRRIARRIARGLAPARLVENRLRVLAPLLIPRAETASALALNRLLARWLIGREIRRMGAGPVEYWCFVPNAVDLLPLRGDHGPQTTDHGPRATVVYYCVDDWGKFHNLDGAWLEEKERRILERADVVFTPARYLEEKCRRVAGERVHYVPHGVEYRKFARAVEAGQPLPSDVASLKRPVIGFYGNLHPWVDFNLVERLASRRPDWSFVLIGEVFCEPGGLRNLPNVHLLGRREHDSLPSYCSAFNAAIIPYDMQQARMESVNPVKTKELLAAGVPIVAADVPELRAYGDDVIVCRTDEEWLDGLDRQVARTDRQAISQRVAGEDWANKVDHLRRVISAHSA